MYFSLIITILFVVHNVCANHSITIQLNFFDWLDMFNRLLTSCIIFAITLGSITPLLAADSTVAVNPTQRAPQNAFGDSTRPFPFRAGDALEIVTFPDSAAFPAGFYSIDGEGFVDFPILGYVKVTSMSDIALAKLLSEKYVDFMHYPHMKIRPLIRVSLTGGFYRPGLYWIDPHTSLWDAIRSAGGTQRPDGFKKIKWERNRVVLNKDLVTLLQEGKSLYQIGFQTGDQVTIIQQPQQTGWEVFRTDVLPILSMFVSTAVSALSVYSTMQIYRNR